MTDLPLFAQQPAWLVQPTDALEQAFAAFHALNPDVYREVERRVWRLLERGEKRIGIARIIEAMRADSDVHTTGDAWKLNNSMRSLYARLLIHHHPQLAGVIETRARAKERQPKAKAA